MAKWVRGDRHVDAELLDAVTDNCTTTWVGEATLEVSYRTIDIVGE